MIVSGIIVLIGLVFLFSKNKNKQIESGFSISFITTGMALITGSFGTFLDMVFGLLTGESVTNNILQLITGFILIFIGLWMRQYIKNKLSILNLLGVKERRIEEHRSDVGFNQFEFKEREIDLGRYVKKMNQSRYDEATELIKLKMQSFYAENKEVKKGYTGTAPIPLTLYAGYCDKGSPTTDFFEYHKLNSKYMKLGKSKKHIFSKKRAYEELKLKQQLTAISHIDTASEVVLGVSITMEVKTNQVQQFNAPFVELSIATPKQNAIIYEDQIQDYKTVIFKTLIELSAKPNIKRIHLLLSCQSSLVFELGKILTTDTYMKEVINYNYVIGSTPCYNWGISFNSQGTTFLQC
ncbi:SAVED domain-containing protein [Bacillus infantis]|uniref:SAVED domain-containing protein n=1 Tax=Bacillus infantis TaxID=324767 RepID=UPI001CD4D394|nr:SAVED domain-containing protein [Bacillus infantis]MCA1042419.1 SAVED domain-containing protein [Bacillus infantis]